MTDGAVTGPNGVVLGVDVHWCPGCRGDKTVELVRLWSDPEPVAVCTECGVGLEAWLTADLVERPRPVGPAAVERSRSAEHGQGAA